MAGTMGKELLEEKIEKAQEDVIGAKKYDASTAILKKLLEKRQVMRTEEVMSANAESSSSYEEIMNYINVNGCEEAEEE